jgi:predicted aldo/keto reductase-like oxidoreductase
MPTYEPMMETFSKAKEAGKARFIGITTHTDEPETIRAAVDAGVWDVILTAYNFMQEHKEEVERAIKYAAEKEVGVIAMKTQGGVRLNQEKKIDVNHGAALKWALNNKNVCTAIPGITTFEQMDLDFSVMKNLSLTNEEKRELKISSLLPGSFYCQQCRSCVPLCPHKVEIPTLMRAYMYAEAYGNLIQAEMTVNDLPRKRGLNTCEGCETCIAECRYGIKISERMHVLRTMNLLKKGSV